MAAASLLRPRRRCRADASRARAAVAAAWRAQAGDTPLHCAARAGKIDCVRLLVQRGADAGAKNNVRRATCAAAGTKHA
jgi:hypothetical protein